MASLPDVRLKMSLRPFTNADVDYAGPFITIQGRSIRRAKAMAPWTYYKNIYWIRWSCSCYECTSWANELTRSVHKLVPLEFDGRIDKW